MTAVREAIIQMSLLVLFYCYGMNAGTGLVLANTLIS